MIYLGLVSRTQDQQSNYIYIHIELQANIFVLNWGRIFKKKTKKYIHVGSDWLDTKIRLCQIIGLIKFKLRKFW